LTIIIISAIISTLYLGGEFMNKKDFKRNLITLGLVSTLTLNTVGCSSSETKNNDSSVTTSISKEVKTYETSDYYLIYLDNNYYLTTREYNFDYSYSYYDVKTGELVGNILVSSPGKIIDVGTYETKYHDYKFFVSVTGFSPNNTCLRATITLIVL